MEQTIVRQTLTPYLVVDDANAALGFYADILGATQTYRLDMPDGRVGHSTMRIGGSEFHLADEYPELGIVGPGGDRRSPVGLSLQVDDPDDTVARAVARGATVEREVADQFYGARAGTFRDPFGHIWTVQKHLRDVPEDEIRRAVEELE
jgi:PhnB protein